MQGALASLKAFAAQGGSGTATAAAPLPLDPEQLRAVEALHAEVHASKRVVAATVCEQAMRDLQGGEAPAEEAAAAAGRQAPGESTANGEGEARQQLAHLSLDGLDVADSSIGSSSGAAATAAVDPSDLLARAQRALDACGFYAPRPYSRPD